MDIKIADTILNTLNSEKEFFDSTETELMGIDGMTKNIASSQARFQALEKAKEEIEYLATSQIKPQWFRDDDFPHRMLQSSLAPVIVYTLGNCDISHRPTISIVGTRHATSYGIGFTRQLVENLAEAIPDIVIISGLAYGIDITAHQAALSAGIATIGVVAHGLATLYPAQHKDIARRMVANGGGLLTEYTHNIRALRGNFLARNRLIAYMADALVVAESAEQGGALSTARHALRIDRPVFALPGRITDTYSQGCNKLISEGLAKLVTSADDIITEMGWKSLTPRGEKTDQSPLSSLTPHELAALRVIASESLADNDLIASVTGIPIHSIMAIMIGLEMKGIVESAPGNRYQLIVRGDFENPQ